MTKLPTYTYGHTCIYIHIRYDFLFFINVCVTVTQDTAYLGSPPQILYYIYLYSKLPHGPFCFIFYYDSRNSTPPRIKALSKIISITRTNFWIDITFAQCMCDYKSVLWSPYMNMRTRARCCQMTKTHNCTKARFHYI